MAIKHLWQATVALGAVFLLGPLAQIRPAAGEPEKRLVVGLKQPATPATLKTLARQLQGTIVQVAPSGAYLLIIPKKGQTAASLRRASAEVAYVEPEIVMGIADPKQALLRVIPVQRPPGRVLGPPPDARR